MFKQLHIIAVASLIFASGCTDQEKKQMYQEIYFDPPTSPSKSGLFDFNEYSHQIFQKLDTITERKPASWINEIKEHVVQLEQTTSNKAKESIEEEFGIRIPEHLNEFWMQIGGLDINGDRFLYSSEDFEESYRIHLEYEPELMKQYALIGGFDDTYYAMKISDSEESSTTVYCWDIEYGVSERTFENIEAYLKEYISWYTTNMMPFCMDEGYVPHPNEN